MAETPLEWVESPERLSSICNEINEDLLVHSMLAIDLEYHTVIKFATILSLVQLSTYRKDYIINALQLRDNALYDGLRVILENPRIVKIVHGGDTDIQLLATDLDICCLNVFDTARAYQFLQKLPQLVQSKDI
jgi:ribonuclease D